MIRIRDEWTDREATVGRQVVGAILLVAGIITLIEMYLRS